LRFYLVGARTLTVCAAPRPSISSTSATTNCGRAMSQPNRGENGSETVDPAGTSWPLGNVMGLLLTFEPSRKVNVTWSTRIGTGLCDCRDSVSDEVNG